MLNDLSMASLLLAQESESSTTLWVVPLLLVGIFIVPFVVGRLLAKGFRMPGYGGKIGLILCTLFAAVAIVGVHWDWNTGQLQLKWGVDLRGGAILVYQIDQEASGLAEATGDGTVKTFGKQDMDSLIAALKNRLNPSGTKEIVIRPYGELQIEIIVPEVDDHEIQEIERILQAAGALEFRIVANARDHQELIDMAKEAAQTLGKRNTRRFSNEEGKVIGKWVRVGRDQSDPSKEIRPFKVSVVSHTVRDAKTGRLLEFQGNAASGGNVGEAVISVPAAVAAGENEALERYLDGVGVKNVDILMAVDPEEAFHVTGDDLASMGASFDEQMMPCVNFSMSSVGGGSTRFGNLTRENLPDKETNFHRLLGIVLDDQLLSAPRIVSTISDRGRITGRFTEEEVSFLVGILRAGRLTTTLEKNPLSVSKVGATLGQDTIRKGSFAIGISLAAVLVFILFYYRFAGLVACLALLVNLVFILALMIILKASMTLPGMAGLVLTVGMSVDANVLIFERIREELTKGSGLRMAIRNGFSRATTTIVDANLTTLITAIVLYAIGTDQIRGFAVTLILGILMCMYTAIFCSRVVFDVAEKRRWISRLGMLRLLNATQINFIGKKSRVAAVLSLVVIVIGLVGVAKRSEHIFDIDFTGGSSVTMTLQEPMTDVEVRALLDQKFDELKEEGTAEQYTLNKVSVSLNSDSEEQQDLYWKIDTSLSDVEALQSVIAGAFSLAHYEMKFDAAAVTEEMIEVASVVPAESTEEPTTEEPAAEEPAAEEPAAEEPAAEEPAAEEPAAEEPAAEEPAENAQSLCQPTGAESSQWVAVLQETTAPSTEEPVSDPSESDGETAQVVADSLESDDSTATESVAEESEPVSEPAVVLIPQTTAQLQFPDKINHGTLTAKIIEAAQALDSPISDAQVELSCTEWDGEDNTPFENWTVTVNVDRAAVLKVFEHLEAEFAATPIWLSSNSIGSKVAGDMKSKAIVALLASLIGIVGYIWIRFQRVMFGLAAVLALVHDILITLGAIALSYWLSGSLQFLLFEEFKISLPVVAAFLTIIGYSLNDTIVVFDRIREVRGKSPELTADMINRSINQTLSRTILTSLTTLIVVLILYFFGGQGIHGFAFALVVGVLVGTYSSVFVASPALLWMMRTRSKGQRQSAPQ